MRSSLTLWVGVFLAFALLLAAWTVMFKVARAARVESVPLVGKEASR